MESFVTLRNARRKCLLIAFDAVWFAWVEGEEGSKKEETYTVVGAAEADPHKGRISNESPLGKALIGHKSGEILKFGI